MYVCVCEGGTVVDKLLVLVVLRSLWYVLSFFCPRCSALTPLTVTRMVICSFCIPNRFLRFIGLFLYSKFKKKSTNRHVGQECLGISFSFFPILSCQPTSRKKTAKGAVKMSRTKAKEKTPVKKQRGHNSSRVEPET